MAQRRRYGRPSLDEGPLITLQQIVVTGLRIAEKEGFGAIGIRRVASELGVWPNTIYHYLPNKQALLELVAEAAMSAQPRPHLSPDLAWEERLRVGSKAWWGALKRYPGLAEFWAGGLSTGHFAEKAIPDLQENIASLLDVGLDETAARKMMIILASMVYGLVQFWIHPSVNDGREARGVRREVDDLFDDALDIIISGIRRHAAGASRAPQQSLAIARMGQP